ncbi:hypothetical protein [Clostridium sp.]|nr:hypothetical protein [Clostridium sp.]
MDNNPRIKELVEMAVNYYKSGLSLKEAINKILIIALEEGLLDE